MERDLLFWELQVLMFAICFSADLKILSNIKNISINVFIYKILKQRNGVYLMDKETKEVITSAKSYIIGMDNLTLIEIN